ncbi:hypothetical protein ACRRTK_004231 [Alexandromys fortis]
MRTRRRENMSKEVRTTPREVHPPTLTVELIYWELTKASGTGTEYAWDETGLSERGGQRRLMRSQGQWH